MTSSSVCSSSVVISHVTFALIVACGHTVVSSAEGGSSDLQVFRVRPQSVAVTAGEDVLLTCVVENQQGKAQWTKDGFALGFEREVPGYPRYTYLGEPSRGEHHLIIKGVTLEDDGEYQCQVGPSRSNTAIWSAANVTVMVAPQVITISGIVNGDGDSEEPKGSSSRAVVEVVAGTSVTLECMVRDARPAPTITWYNNGIELDPDADEEEVMISEGHLTWSVTSHLLVRPQPKDHQHQYSCRALHPALKASHTIIVAFLTLNVLYPPKAPVIRGYHPGDALLESEQRTLSCEVMGGNPRPRVTWYRHGRPLHNELPWLHGRNLYREKSPFHKLLKTTSGAFKGVSRTESHGDVPSKSSISYSRDSEGGETSGKNTSNSSDRDNSGRRSSISHISNGSSSYSKKGRSSSSSSSSSYNSNSNDDGSSGSSRSSIDSSNGSSSSSNSNRSRSSNKDSSSGISSGHGDMRYRHIISTEKYAGRNSNNRHDFHGGSSGTGSFVSSGSTTGLSAYFSFIHRRTKRASRNSNNRIISKNSNICSKSCRNSSRNSDRNDNSSSAISANDIYNNLTSSITINRYAKKIIIIKGIVDSRCSHISECDNPRNTSATSYINSGSSIRSGSVISRSKRNNNSNILSRNRDNNNTKMIFKCSSNVRYRQYFNFCNNTSISSNDKKLFDLGIEQVAEGTQDRGSTRSNSIVSSNGSRKNNSHHNRTGSKVEGSQQQVELASRRVDHVASRKTRSMASRRNGNNRSRSNVSTSKRRKSDGNGNSSNKSVVVQQVVGGSRAEDGATYECRVTTNLLQTPLTSTVTLTVHYPPTWVKVSGSAEATLGEQFSLSCVTSPANPPATITWMMQGKEVIAASTEVTEDEDGGWVTWSDLTHFLPNSQQMNDVTVHCHAYSPASDHLVSDTWIMRIIKRPGPPVLEIVPWLEDIGETERKKHEDIKRKEETDRKTDFKHALKSWTSDEQNEEQQKDQENQEWTKAVQNDSASSAWGGQRGGRKPAVSKGGIAAGIAGDEAVIETRYARGRVILEAGQLEGSSGNGTVVAGTLLNIGCTSEGANPPPGVTLYKGEERLPLTMSHNGNVTRAKAKVKVIAADNGQELRCEVSNSAANDPVVTSTILNVLFPAWKVSSWVTPENLEAGQMLTLTCESSTSQPPSHLTWISRGTTLPTASVTHFRGNFGGTVSRSELRLRAQADDNGRVFTCQAENDLHVPVSTNITLNVLHAPVWVSVPLDVVDVKEGDDLLVTVAAYANPSPVRYSWWRGPVAIKGTVPGKGSISTGTPTGISMNVLNGTETSSQGLNREAAAAAAGNSETLTIKNIHRQQADNYAVTATNQQGSINASFVVNVLYGPENLIANARVTVDEGGPTSVLCSAVGNPSPNITWTRDNISLSQDVGEASLVLEKATRNDTGFYHCQAANSVSVASPVTTALVVTQAPKGMSDEERKGFGREWAVIGGIGRLDCRVKAVPAPAFKWSLNKDRVLYNGRKYFIRVPKLIDGLTEWSSVLEIRNITPEDYRNYTCLATNTRGVYTTSHSLASPIPPTTPTAINVTAVTPGSVLASWVPGDDGSEPEGYTVRYQVPGSSYYDYKNVSGSNATTVVVDGLIPGASYSFTVQSFNEQGSSPFSSPPLDITMLGMLEGPASSSSSSSRGQHKRVPRLLLLLISLTGTALLVLNVSIIVYFVRRYNAKRHMGGSGTRVSTSATSNDALLSYQSDTENTNTRASYKMVCHTAVRENSDDENLSNYQTSTATPIYQDSQLHSSHVSRIATDSPRSLLGNPATPPLPSSVTRYATESPIMPDCRISPCTSRGPPREDRSPNLMQCHVSPSHQNYLTVIDDESPRIRSNSLSAKRSSIRSKHDNHVSRSNSLKYKRNSPRHRVTSPPLIEVPMPHKANIPQSQSACKWNPNTHIPTEDVMPIRMQTPTGYANIPDVCLESSTTAYEGPPPHQQEGNYLPKEQDQVSLSSQHSTDSYLVFNTKEYIAPSPPTGIPRSRSVCSAHEPPPPGSPQTPTARSGAGSAMSPHQPNLRLQDHRPQSPLTPRSNVVSTSQVIYHGQPHIQQEMERQQKIQQMKEKEQEYFQHLQESDKQECYQETDTNNFQETDVDFYQQNQQQDYPYYYDDQHRNTQPEFYQPVGHSDYQHFQKPDYSNPNTYPVMQCCQQQPLQQLQSNQLQHQSHIQQHQQQQQPQQQQQQQLHLQQQHQHQHQQHLHPQQQHQQQQLYPQHQHQQHLHPQQQHQQQQLHPQHQQPQQQHQQQQQQHVHQTHQLDPYQYESEHFISLNPSKLYNLQPSCCDGRCERQFPQEDLNKHKMP